MEKKYKKSELDFSEITPKMQIKKVYYSKLYKKAFLKNHKPYASEHSQNTTTWE